MVTNITKSERASILRERLAGAMQKNNVSQSALARMISVDRSTLSQILNSDGMRMPNAQLVADCATSLGVSCDWLLGLTDRPESAVDLLAASMLMTQAPRALIDEQIFSWYREAAGLKIRHVPATLPDMLKTHEMLKWEYEPHLGRTTDQAIGASQDRLEWMRAQRSDFELAFPTHELESFAQAEGYYKGVPHSVRKQQLERLLELHEQLYPTLRLYLFDSRRLWSSPVTIFGPKLAVLYLGRNYLTFKDDDKIQEITRHFDWLVREAAVSDREVPDFVNDLLGAIK